MAINVACTCGRTMQVSSQLAGKTVQCPRCESVLTVPEDIPEVNFDVVDEEKVVEAAPVRTDLPSRRPRIDDDDIGDRDMPRPRPPRPRRRRPPRDDYSYRGHSSIAVTRGIIYGIIMMVVALVWFVLALMVGWIAFYPPILFVAGLVRMIMGFLGHADDDDGRYWW
jgi:hypothetical protein